MSLRSITEDDFAAWHTRDQRRKELEREARTLKTANDQLAERVQAALEQEGKSEVRRGAYRAFLKDGRASVAWKEAFVRELGPEKASALQDEAPARRTLAIELL